MTDPAGELLTVAAASVGEDRKLESAMMGSRMACVSRQISRTFAVMSVILMSLSKGTTVRCNHDELR